MWNMSIKLDGMFIGIMNVWRTLPQKIQTSDAASKWAKIKMYIINCPNKYVKREYWNIEREHSARPWLKLDRQFHM